MSCVLARSGLFLLVLLPPLSLSFLFLSSLLLVEWLSLLLLVGGWLLLLLVSSI